MHIIKCTRCPNTPYNKSPSADQTWQQETPLFISYLLLLLVRLVSLTFFFCIISFIFQSFSSRFYSLPPPSSSPASSPSVPPAPHALSIVLPMAGSKLLNERDEILIIFVVRGDDLFYLVLNRENPLVIGGALLASSRSLGGPLASPHIFSPFNPNNVAVVDLFKPLSAQPLVRK